jgi:transcriptional regulator GlxA family with amidase domain
MKTQRVAILAVDGVLPLDFGIPAQIFASRRGLPYRTTICAEAPEVASADGYNLVVPGTLTDVRRADMVIVPGYLGHATPLSEEVLDALRHVHGRGRRLMSICVGAFALAQAGILEGLRATTHWRNTEELARGYPNVTVDRDVLYVDEGNVLTSAGVAAGIDLCLHVIRRDLGAAIANHTARAIVAAPHRDGGQAQFVDAPVGRPTGSLAVTRAWSLDNLHNAVSVRDLARHADVSERTLARRWLEETGLTPLQWLLRARIQLARELIEAADLSVDQIAARCGLGTAANLRLHFRRFVGATPTAYRRSFVGDWSEPGGLQPVEDRVSHLRRPAVDRE